MGTPDFAVPALVKLAEAGHQIVAVYTAPPKPAGRGQELKKSAVHQASEKLGLPVMTPASLKAETLPPAEIAVVAAYGLLLPEHILKGPQFGCINIHPSKLPRWRGAAPLQRTIMAGDKETAVCIMQMDKGLDTGDVLAEQSLNIEGWTAGQLHDKCAEIGAELVLKVVEEIEKIKPVKQSEIGVTYAKKLTRDDEKINWNQPAEIIECQIRGLNPYPGAYFEYKGEKIKTLSAELVSGEGVAGVALDDNLTIACGNGAIKITQLQKPGKRALTAKEFLNGTKIPKGEKL